MGSSSVIVLLMSTLGPSLAAIKLQLNKSMVRKLYLSVQPNIKQAPAQRVILKTNKYRSLSIYIVFLLLVVKIWIINNNERIVSVHTCAFQCLIWPMLTSVSRDLQELWIKRCLKIKIIYINNIWGCDNEYFLIINILQ